MNAPITKKTGKLLLGAFEPIPSLGVWMVFPKILIYDSLRILTILSPYWNVAVKRFTQLATAGIQHFQRAGEFYT